MATHKSRNPKSLGSHSDSGTFRSAVAFATGSGFAKAIGFLLLPIYARTLTPADYGVLSIATAVSALGGTLLSFGVEFPLLRTWFELESDGERQRGMLGSLWRLMLTAPVAISLCVGSVAWFVLGNESLIPGWAVFLALVIGGLYEGATGLPFVVIRAQKRLRAFMALTAIDALTSAALSLLFVVALRMGVLGLLLGGILGTLVALAAALRIVPWPTRISFDRKVVTSIVSTGISMMPHFVAMQGLVLADRLLLTRFVSLSSLGIYGMAANFALPVMVGVQAVNQALQPTYARGGVGAESVSAVSKAVRHQVCLVAWLTSSGVLLAPGVIKAMLPDTYWQAADIVGWLILGYGFLGLYSVPMNGAGLGAGRTRRTWIPTATSVAINLVLVVGLAPSLGILGAGIASAVGYLVLFIGIFLWAAAGDTIVIYEWRWLSTIAGIAIGATLPCLATVGDAGLANFALRTCVALLIGMALVAVDRAASTSSPLASS